MTKVRGSIDLLVLLEIYLGVAISLLAVVLNSHLTDPIDGRADPIDGRAGPIYGRADPIDGRAHPIHGRAHPIDGRADPIDGRADQLMAEQIQLMVEQINDKLSPKIVFLVFQRCYSPFNKTCNSSTLLSINHIKALSEIMNGLLSLWFATWDRGCCKFY